MRYIRIFICLIITALLCFGVTACSKDTSEAYIYFQLDKKPVTLDPQTASDDCELMIIRNIYEGLLKKNSNGKIVCGACENYQKKGLSYSFNIRKNAKWSNGDDLVANDFVFALRRAVLKKTQAPFAERLFCIKNARDVYKGKKPSSALAVKAVDSKTLVITLEKKDSYFEETLTSSICMPCNSKFFKESIGKYGLERDYIISNGSYVLTKWNKDDFGIRLYRNDSYHGDFTAKNAAVFISKSEKETPVEILKKDTGDIAFLDSTFLTEAKKESIKIKTVPNILWVLTIGEKFDFQTRKCFAKAFSSKIYENSLPKGFEAAESLYPQIIKKSKNTAHKGMEAYDIKYAKTKMGEIINSFDETRFPSSTLYYYSDPAVKQALTDIVGHWQQNLSAYINIKEVEDLNELIDQLKKRSLDFAVFPITAKNASSKEYLKNFNCSLNDPLKAQISVFSDKSILPIAFENTNIAFVDNIKLDFIDNGNGYIDFSFIEKVE